MGDLIFIALGVLVVWYVVSSFFSKAHSSEYKEFAKEQARNRARKEARKKEEATLASEGEDNDGKEE